MLECPVCESDNVRVSFNTPLWEFLYRWQGLQRYRCRECRKVFHYPLAPGEQFTTKPRRRRSRPRNTTGGIILNGWQAKVLQGAFFVVMVVVFFAALKAMNI
jgi:hypothetical protein